MTLQIDDSYRKQIALCVHTKLQPIDLNNKKRAEIRKMRECDKMTLNDKWLKAVWANGEKTLTEIWQTRVNMAKTEKYVRKGKKKNINKKWNKNVNVNDGESDNNISFTKGPLFSWFLFFAFRYAFFLVKY